ncbi:MAG: UDP-N-acetylmuramoyl-L-alanine--D-glutamate ligase [Clostridia bacterium]|nr:UDP-N-acetylmuramoyl-L-alanine--D-glutamate ligase [Clostridia bacterium]
MSHNLIEFLKDKDIVILGFGREGVSTYNYIRKYFPEKPLAIADKKEISIDDKNVTLLTGDGYMDKVFDYGLVIKTPGVPIVNIEIPENVLITCQVDLFLQYAPCKKIGITGTKGKTTTSTLIYNLVSEAGNDAYLVGNIGVPVFDIIDECEGKIAVIEMSCHQLEFCRTSPDVAVFTNIYEEHLDHYDGYRGYINAKLNIVNHQTDENYLIYNADQNVEGLIDFSQYKSRKIAVSAKPQSEYQQKLTTLNDRLIGKHCHQDIFFAEAVARLFGADDEAVVRGVEKFTGIPHRMEPVGTFKGISFYNDSIATIPHAVECAVDALGTIETLIFGGLDRGIYYDDFVTYLDECSITNIIGMPETGTKICKALIDKGTKKNVVPVETMEEAVAAAYEFTSEGKTCLLSPAAPSYNVYRNFEHKGNHYKEIVKKLGETV